MTLRLHHLLFILTYMNIKKNSLLMCLFWLLAVITSFTMNYLGAMQAKKQLALFTARSIFQQIVITRQWNALHGGVYVPVTADTQPNPYLESADRDLILDEKLVLTKINPAFMTRQISELAQESEGIQFHITSLKPLRPENSANERESQYLKQFEKGLAEGSAFLEINEEPHYFYMAPLRTDKTCLPCHAKQGYMEGDIRGGISILMPFALHIPISIMALSHAIIALLGIFGILLITRKLDDSYTIIKNQAVMDALTDIPNRRSFSESILREFDRSQRGGEPLSLIMCDIDNFKVYNDTYGHTAGDTCLKRVAQGIVSALNRPGDLCARYGGEEFVVILTSTSLKGAINVAERIRLTIEGMQIKHNAASTSKVVTISLGVATMSNNNVSNYEELIKQADEALYQAKLMGRNQVQYYQG